MKRCPQCNRVETDDSLAFCRADGVALGRPQQRDQHGLCSRRGANRSTADGNSELDRVGEEVKAMRINFGL